MGKPLAFENDAATIAFSIAIAGWVLFEYLMRVRQRSLRSGRAARDPSGVILAGCLTASVVAAIALGQHGPLLWPGARLWPLVAGLALLAAGVALRAWSISALGRLFQYRIEVQPEHHVVAGGPYRYVRHPSYTGVALVVIGIALAAGDVVGLAVAAALAAAGLAVRVRAEESQLIEALGREYEQFAAHRKRFIPGLW